MIAVVAFLIFFVIFTYFVCMSGYTTKRKIQTTTKKSTWAKAKD